MYELSSILDKNSFLLVRINAHISIVIYGLVVLEYENAPRN